MAWLWSTNKDQDTYRSLGPKLRHSLLGCSGTKRVLRVRSQGPIGGYKEFRNSKRHDQRENRLKRGTGKVDICVVGASPWVDEGPVCTKWCWLRGHGGHYHLPCVSAERWDQHFLRFADKRPWWFWGEVINFMTLIRQLFWRMPHNWVHMMFPHDSIQVMHLWQEYHGNNAVFFSLNSINGTWFQIVHLLMMLIFVTWLKCCLPGFCLIIIRS